jgi:tetratricopeptide (TPR) repeat protein
MSHAGTPVTALELSVTWSLIYGALISDLFLLREASRTSMGFRAVPLCTLAKEDGSIDEMFSLHAWLPDQPRGNPGFTMSFPGSFAQSWVLAGEVKLQPFEVQTGLDQKSATYTEHALSCTGALDTSGTCCTNNRGAFVQTTALDPAFYTTDMSYTVPESMYHKMDVTQNVVHAVILFVHSRSEPMKEVKVLHPRDAGAVSGDLGNNCTNLKPAIITNIVNAARAWDLYMVRGKQHIAHSELELALRAFQGALNISSVVELFPKAVDYRHSAMGMLGYTNRLFGRYNQAKEILEGALSEMGPTMERVSISGELGVVYRHMGLIEDAKHAFEVQYETAKQLNFKRAMCRAIGNLGMVNYQLSQDKTCEDPEALLELAIVQLAERVTAARQIKEEDGPASLADPAKILRRRKQAAAWELIGLSRLSLCHTVTGNLKEAIAVAAEGEALARTIEDWTVLAVSQFFYGRALLKNGQHEQALEQFNPPDHKSTPAIALCQEPSEENRQYLRELIDAGADMDLDDEHGYSALDYAVFAGDVKAEAIVLEGLQKTDRYKDAAENLANRRAEALLRKGYRELFQEKLRPVLLLGGGDYSLQMLRRAYAQALAEDENKRQLFDELKFMRFSDFCAFGRLPRSSDGLVQAIKSGDDVADFIIFFSYRWIGKSDGASSPDDSENTQYRRMIQATEEFLRLHPAVNRENLGIWMVGVFPFCHFCLTG